MFQKFFTNTLESKFIKALIANTPLPLMNTVSDSDIIIKNCIYIYKTNVIKCLKSEYIINSGTTDPNIYPEAEYQSLQPYTFGSEYKLFTEKHFSRYGYYDPDTHYYLGKYLRCFRDIYDVDLMPFYNCFNYKTINDLHLTKSLTTGYVQQTSDKYKVIAVPIKFNKTYTIAIDCPTALLLKAIFHNSLGLVDTFIDATKINLTDKLNDKVKLVNSSTFTQPFTYQIDCADPTMLPFERYLNLIIQLPSNNNSSIVVLEGDYTFKGSQKIYNESELHKLSNTTINNLLISKLSLLQLNDHNIYAFSDRLIEFLLLNAICSAEDISDNIKSVQSLVNYSNSNSMSGVWDEYLRSFLFKQYMSSNNTKLDITGYVDKDIEKFILNRRNS